MCIGTLGWQTADTHTRRHAVYSFDDVSGDNALNSFNINNAPSYLFSVLNDIRSINSLLRIHILPWSPVCRRCYPQAAYRMHSHVSAVVAGMDEGFRDHERGKLPLKLYQRL